MGEESDSEKHFKKRALIVTLNSDGLTGGVLPGPANDGLRTKRVLEARGFKVTWLRDDLPKRWIDPDTNSLYPSPGNVRLWMAALSGNAREGDSLFFHFSGHGYQDGHDCLEKDGLDENISLR